MHSWPHAPARRPIASGALFVTAGTYGKAPFFRGKERMELLQSQFFCLADEHGIDLEAWALFPNHYHFIGRVEEGLNAKEFFKTLHGRTALAVNRLDGVQGRKVWTGYRDTTLTNSGSYLARLHYVHTNAVKHGLVQEARMYPYSSAHWFETQADDAHIRTVYSFPIDRLVIEDD